MKLSKYHRRLFNIAMAIFFTGIWITYLIFFSRPDYPEISKEQLIEYLENRQVEKAVLVLKESSDLHGTIEIKLQDEALPESYKKPFRGVFFASSNAHFSLPVEDINALRADVFGYFNKKLISSGFDYSIEIRSMSPGFILSTSVIMFLLFFFSYIFPILVGGFIIYFGIKYLTNLNQPAVTSAKKPELTQKRVSVRSADKILLLPLENIAAFYARHNYVYAYHKDGHEYLTDQTLAQLQENLPDHFVRVHRSSIVNIYYVFSIDKEKGGKHIITLSDPKQKQIRVSQAYGHTVSKMANL
jgi:hypothetical protein